MAKSFRDPRAVMVSAAALGIAAGVALGTTVIAPNLPEPDALNAVEAPQEELRDTRLVNEQLASQLAAANEVMVPLVGQLVSADLAGRPVLVLSSAQARRGDLDSLNLLLADAQAVPAGHIRLLEDFFDIDRADELSSLVASLLPAGAQLSTQYLDAGTHAGQALAAALLLDPDTTEPLASTEDRATLLSTLKEAGFIDYQEGSILPAQGVLFVDSDSEVGYPAEILANVVGAFDEQGARTVLAAHYDAAQPDHCLDIIRSGRSSVGSPAISTVDSIANEFARVAAIRALAEQFDGGHGHYGASRSAQGFQPEP